MPSHSAFKTIAFDELREVHWGSDIEAVKFSSSGLSITVARELSGDTVKGLNVLFLGASAFRYLDELDLARYWASGDFVRRCHVLEVLAGGWADEESELQGFAKSRREWIIVTGNGCVSVFSPHTPAVTEVSWRRDA